MFLGWLNHPGCAINAHMIGGLPFWLAVPIGLLALLAGVAVFNHVLREFFPLDTEPQNPAAGLKRDRTED